MLGAIENLLLPALQAALPAGPDLAAGPAVAPADGGAGRVAVHAVRLNCEPRDGADDDPVRDPAFAGWQGALAAAPGQPLDFTLPDAAVGELAEVHCPPGRILAHGDAYLLDGRTLRFFRAPPGPVFARTRGPRCAGYRERSGGRIELELRAWATTAASVDDLLARSLGAVLARFEQINVIELAAAPPGLAARLTKPRIGLAGIERRLDPDAPKWVLGTARCIVRGELELTLSLGAPEAEGRIAEVDVAVHLPKGGG